MPVYEYACDECHKVTEALRKMSDADAPQVCEHCGSQKTRRALSIPMLSSGSGGGSRGQSQGGHVHSGSCGCGKPRGSCGM